MGHGREEEIAAWIISLLGLKGVGTKIVSAFLNEGWSRIEVAERLDADFVEALETDGMARATRIAKALRDGGDGALGKTWEERVTEAYETLEYAAERGIHVLHPFMSEYPKRLLRNQSYPPILYCRGCLESLNPEKAVAIIGTREPTSFGSRMGRRLAQILAEDGYTIVSGLAVGCDTVGHEGALDVSGKTVAVLPTPIDAPVYPKQNQGLAERILEADGALISEYAPRSQLSNRQLISNLVARDEWQPALSDGVIAIETSVDGGTRHAINHALNTGTPVAVFDYRSNDKLRAAFETDPRFGGNMKYLDQENEVTPIYGPETIDAFKARMDAFRQAGDGGLVGCLKAKDGVQQALPLD